MRGIERIAPEDPSRTNNPDRWLHLLHGPYLHGGRVGAENKVFSDVERVAWFPRGMTRRKVERLEVIERVFDFRSVLDRVAHRNENIFDFLTDDRERMAMPQASAAAGQADVNGFL